MHRDQLFSSLFTGQFHSKPIFFKLLLIYVILNFAFAPLCVIFRDVAGLNLEVFFVEAESLGKGFVLYELIIVKFFKTPFSNLFELLD